jgi:hypothetical protein
MIMTRMKMVMMLMPAAVVETAERVEEKAMKMITSLTLSSSASESYTSVSLPSPSAGFAGAEVGPKVGCEYSAKCSRFLR